MFCIEEVTSWWPIPIILLMLQVTPSPTACCPSRGWRCSRRPSSSWTLWPPGRATTGRPFSCNFLISSYPPYGLQLVRKPIWLVPPLQGQFFQCCGAETICFGSGSSLPWRSRLRIRLWLQLGEHAFIYWIPVPIYLARQPILNVMLPY